MITGRIGGSKAPQGPIVPETAGYDLAKSEWIEEVLLIASYYNLGATSTLD
jgi:hypothetical protein